MMQNNNWNKIDQNDRRFENAIRILHIGIVSMVVLPVVYFIVRMFEVNSFSITYLFAIFGVIIFGVFLWTFLDICISYFIDIKFIRNNLQKSKEDVKRNPSDGSTDQNSRSLEYNPIRENPASYMEYPDQKRPHDNL